VVSAILVTPIDFAMGITLSSVSRIGNVLVEMGSVVDFFIL
jgi:hypothetical protein